MSEQAKVMRYVVQQACEQPLVTADDEGREVSVDDAWIDIATVEVPARTKRSTVIKEALKQAGVQPAADGSRPRLRALDAESAHVHEPEPHQPPMEWRVP
jgi:hypothetical protein